MTKEQVSEVSALCLLFREVADWWMCMEGVVSHFTARLEFSSVDCHWNYLVPVSILIVSLSLSLSLFVISGELSDKSTVHRFSVAKGNWLYW